MADRTSAGLFGMVFGFLAEQPDDRSKALAARLWRARTGYDFSDYQLEADDALVALGLAVKCGKCGAIDYVDDDAHECEVAHVR